MFRLRRILGIILVLAIIAAGTFVVLDVLNSEAANVKPADPSEQNKDDPTEEPVIVKPKNRKFWTILSAYIPAGAAGM